MPARGPTANAEELEQPLHPKFGEVFFGGGSSILPGSAQGEGAVLAGWRLNLSPILTAGKHTPLAGLGHPTSCFLRSKTAAPGVFHLPPGPRAEGRGGRAASAAPGEVCVLGGDLPAAGRAPGLPRIQGKGESCRFGAASVSPRGPERGTRSCRHPPPRWRAGLVPPHGRTGPAGPAGAHRTAGWHSRPGHGENAPSSAGQHAGGRAGEGGEVSKGGGTRGGKAARVEALEKTPPRYGFVKRQRPFARHCNCKIVTRTGSTSSCGCCPLSDAGRGPVSIVQQQLPSAGAPSASKPTTEWSKQGGTREGHPGGRGVSHD